MPIYEYKCECGNEKDVLLSFQNSKPQVCECGRIMQRMISIPSFVMKQTGNQMALDTLNSNAIGGKRKAMAEQRALEGIQTKEKTVF